MHYYSRSQRKHEVGSITSNLNIFTNEENTSKVKLWHYVLHTKKLCLYSIVLASVGIQKKIMSDAEITYCLV